MPHRFSRRTFLASSGAAARGSFIILTLPAILAACSRATEARLDGARLQTLAADEAATLNAIAMRIIPTDETPGAQEAGVVYFMDQVLGDEREAELLRLRAGLQQLQAVAVRTYAVDDFRLLDAAQQDQLLTDIQDSEFFATMRFLTVAGMFALPEYGGNPARIGNYLSGFDNRHVWQPPYGYYDADYAAKGE